MYDGNPAHPDLGGLWRLAERTADDDFGTSAPYLDGLPRRRGVVPAPGATFGRLRAVGSTGSPLPPEGFGWVYEQRRKRHLAVLDERRHGRVHRVRRLCARCCRSTRARCSAARLGAKVRGLRRGRPSVVDEVGELVITEPMPSMPVGFWNDPDGSPLPGELLRHVSRRLAPRRLDQDHPAGRRGHLRPVGLDDQPPAASAWARARSTARSLAVGDVVDALVVDLPRAGGELVDAAVRRPPGGRRARRGLRGRDQAPRPRGLLAAPRPQHVLQIAARSRARCRESCSRCR